MNKAPPIVSIIIVDYKKKNPYLAECLDAIQKQSYRRFEIILICDYKIELNYPKLRQKYFGHYVGPAEKRDVPESPLQESVGKKPPPVGLLPLPSVPALIYIDFCFSKKDSSKTILL
ncbi:MAG: hypothetical protein UW84_C0009G0015 [Candidatus Collierbacteria bacterium GW2011_GWA2_44_99]|uniref:Glycosyltransferase 2-like domain-containing protein n=1 Tax=Candidatus Collierbacteria bacterium GW2011_GWA2_44_99 TaxID=1618380 RepID=A0A0G1KSK5_9BACT|nr:MAG: hypothetical protein UW84_C0009G0015 [Candidatus Collierbacteria bacterium GW2011_GWA2_44_99]